MRKELIIASVVEVIRSILPRTTMMKDPDGEGQPATIRAPGKRLFRKAPSNGKLCP